jgi:hypothetical protein
MANFPKFTRPQQADPDTAFQQPTGATTTGTGIKADQTNPALQRVAPPQQPGGKPAMPQPSNTWTQHSGPLQGVHIDPWIKTQQLDNLPPPSFGNEEKFAEQFANLAQFDATMQRIRMKLTPKPWSRTGGVPFTTGTAGAANIQPDRVLLDGIHNPNATIPTTIAIGELDGDPIPKLNVTLAAFGVVTFPTGILFEHGVTVLTNSAGLPLTFWGRTLD